MLYIRQAMSGKKEDKLGADMENDRVFDIVSEIEERHKETEEGFSYKDSLKLKELSAIADEWVKGNVPATDKAAINAYLGKAYERMGRVYPAAKRYTLSVGFFAQAFLSDEKQREAFAKNLASAVKCRNYYEDDDCADLKELSLKVLGEEFDFSSLLSHCRSLKHDPVEKSEKYLAVIDEVDEKISKNRTVYGMGACHEMWGLKARFLAEKGIEWHSPAVLNPCVRFD